MCNILRSYFVNINNVAEMENLTQTFLLQLLHNKNKYVIFDPYCKPASTHQQHKED